MPVTHYAFYHFLARQILIWIHCGCPQDSHPSPTLSPAFCFHLLHLIKGGYVNGVVHEGVAPCGTVVFHSPHIRSLTSQGREAAEALSDDSFLPEVEAKVAHLPMNEVPFHRWIALFRITAAERHAADWC